MAFGSIPLSKRKEASGFDVEEELTADPAAMDAVGEMLDETEKLAEKAKAAIKEALADEDSRYHSVVTFFM